MLYFLFFYFFFIFYYDVILKPACEDARLCEWNPTANDNTGECEEVTFDKDSCGATNIKSCLASGKGYCRYKILLIFIFLLFLYF
jgi:hypothetical protein